MAQLEIEGGCFAKLRISGLPGHSIVDSAIRPRLSAARQLPNTMHGVLPSLIRWQLQLFACTQA